MNILITGAQGFVGKNCVALVSHYQVVEKHTRRKMQTISRRAFIVKVGVISGNR